MRWITVVLAAVVLAGCGNGADPPDPVRRELPAARVSEYGTAYISAVVPAGTDTRPEHLVVSNRHDTLRADLGGWAVVDGDGNRIPIPPSTQLEAGRRLIVYPGSGPAGPSPAGTPDVATITGGLEGDVLDDGGEVVRLLDAGGNEVARFDYGG